MRRLVLSRADAAAITLGGIGGAILRQLFTNPAPPGGGWLNDRPRTSVNYSLEPGMPVRIIVVNLAGCLLLGGLTVLLLRSNSPGKRRLLGALATGFCGSLTTFSTFAVETASRIRGDASFSNVLGYLAVSVIGGGLAFLIGRMTVRRFAT